MTEIGFYHLTRTPLERALPALLEKALAAGMRAVVMAGSEERIEALNQLLWSYEERSFLPHGSKRDGRPERQPVWLTTEDENPNGADCLVLTDGAVSTRVGAFRRCLDLFDGQDPDAVEAARLRWKDWKAAGHELSYWQQDESGRWQRKA
ncbi:MAG TPA: DNA polymerase III subunit chi [Alphaproteobacteria bacterium]|nr:DNA polymerase III subunit chi [Alphaproteobacteria bacterium]